MTQKGTYPPSSEEKMRQLGEENKKLRRIYEQEFCPLINKEEHTDADAFSFLVEHPEIKPYLSWRDLKTMYDYAESQIIQTKKILEETKIKVSEISEKLKGLEGKIK